MQCSHFSSKLVAAAASLALLPALVYAQTPLQLNVPYSCQDGVTRTITRCEKNERAEVCFWREEQNGQVNERYNVRGQMDGWLASCKVQAAPSPAAPAPGTAGQAAPGRPGQDARVVTANPSPPARTAPAPAKPAVGPPDPGIAKARTANVDTKVFGIQLGEPLALPECDLFGRTPRPCIEDAGDVAGLIGALFGGNPNPQEGTELTVALPDSSCPTWITGCIFAATIQNGRLVAAKLTTKGREVEKAVAAELRGKYGNRVSMQQRIITPNDFSKEFDVWDLDWELPGLHVEYKVLDTGINDGYVRIESESLYEARKAKAREAARPKL